MYARATNIDMTHATQIIPASQRHCSHSITIFAGLPKSTIDRLQSVLHATARIITGCESMIDHTYPERRRSLLPVPQRITFKLCPTVYKALQGKTHYIAKFCCSVAATHYRSRLHSATCSDLEVPWTHLELGERSFAVTGPTASSNLPLSVRLAPSITSFKTALKTHLFNASYDALKYHWFAYASMITIYFYTIYFCKAPLRCLHLRCFINGQY